MKRAAISGIVMVMVLVVATLFAGGSKPTYGMADEAARGKLTPEFARVDGVIKRMPQLSGGMIYSAREAFATGTTTPTPAPTPIVSTLGCANRTSFGDVRVNQDCTLQRQTDAEIAVNPVNPENLIAAQNDSSIGWNHCGFDYSLDGGLHWGSGIPPFFQRGNHPTKGHTLDDDAGTMHTYDAASDPSMAFDSRGNAYLSCVLFDINDPANGILVAKSPAVAQGSYYGVVPSYSGKGKDPATGVVIEDNTTNATADDEKIAADSFPTSPYRDDVYVTWTEFIASPLCTQGGICSSPIYFSRSKNHGRTWSKPVEISGNSRALCSNGNLFDKRRKPHDCDLDEGSQPVVLPNGDIVVVFNNSNTSGSDENDQILDVVSKDGGTTWARPALIGADVVEKEPQCSLNDGNGPEECIPGAYIRANDDPRATVDPETKTVYAVWNDYSKGRYAIRIATSTTAGKTWTEQPGTIDSGNRDCYMPAVAVDSLTHALSVSYYCTGRVTAEDSQSGLFKPGSNGTDDEPSHYYLATASTAAGPWTAVAVSPSFNPPVGPQADYNGDYSGLAVSGNTAYPAWSDTRNEYGTGNAAIADEDIFTVAKSLP